MLASRSLRPSTTLRRSLSSAANSDARLLVLNAGSSSLKYKMFGLEGKQVGSPVFSGLVELSPSEGKHGCIKHTSYSSSGEEKNEKVELPLHSHKDALQAAVERYFHAEDMAGLAAIGHRIVHGGEKIRQAALIDAQVKKAIESNVSLAPLHNPPGLLGIDVATQVFGNKLPNVGVFDTAFHADMPPKAYMYALPYELYEKHGVRRYGFHGTSHQFVTEKAASILGCKTEECNIITCHLGNGASMAAVKNGTCVDTTMGVTPLEGLVMGTRSGDVDPALHSFLTNHLDMKIDDVDKMLNKESGLLGLCGDSDVRHIQDRVREGDEQAALALDVFAHRVRKYLGAYLLELAGECQAIVFTAGTGESSAMIRERVCNDLAFVGIELDDEKNGQAMMGEGPTEIQSKNSKIKVLVLPTDEELSIADQTARIAF